MVRFSVVWWKGERGLQPTVTVVTPSIVAGVSADKHRGSEETDSFPEIVRYRTKVCNNRYIPHQKRCQPQLSARKSSNAPTVVLKHLTVVAARATTNAGRLYSSKSHSCRKWGRRLRPVPLAYPGERYRRVLYWECLFYGQRLFLCLTGQAS